MPVTERHRLLVRPLEREILQRITAAGTQRQDATVAVGTVVTGIDCDGVRAGFWITTETDRTTHARGVETRIFLPFAAVGMMVNAIALHATPVDKLRG